MKNSSEFGGEKAAYEAIRTQMSPLWFMLSIRVSQ